MATRNLHGVRHHLLLCNGGSCMKRGGEEVTQGIREQIANLAADDLIHTTRTRCNGRCADACVVIQYPEGIWYQDMTAETGKQLINRIVSGEAAYDAHNITYTYQKGEFLPAQQAEIGGTKKQPS
ncbi:(2Fe-2S) ferredoxin domain-containing protein [Aneurinibacillus sp. REN35]|uniref:(2Fe-2S) ferredoxin domain-containing protein n=1 Tax=Aneurinibacillus sp. REN35 TaxID=3237286 RepID=UPI003529714B